MKRRSPNRFLLLGEAVARPFQKQSTDFSCTLIGTKQGLATGV